MDNRLKMIELMILYLIFSNMAPSLLKIVLTTATAALIFWNFGNRLGNLMEKADINFRQPK